MQTIVITPHKQPLITYHSKASRRYRWGDLLTTEQVLAIIGAKALRQHSKPFAKRKAGRLRRQERAFVMSRKCGFSCD